ncbi:MAG: hypothetical protein VYE62_07410, partial [Pseudomonadota bacterium]|nr:hypothetical protein [Pseudomonadota bacterium]
AFKALQKRLNILPLKSARNIKILKLKEIENCILKSKSQNWGFARIMPTTRAGQGQNDWHGEANVRAKLELRAMKISQKTALKTNPA